jgi:type II secretory pathway component PulM
MLSITKKYISQAGLDRYLTQLKQNTNESIEMHFQKVEFDRLIRLLTVLINEQHFTLLQISSVAENPSGIVNADVILKS